MCLRQKLAIVTKAGAQARPQTCVNRGMQRCPQNGPSEIADVRGCLQIYVYQLYRPAGTEPTLARAHHGGRVLVPCIKRSNRHFRLAAQHDGKWNLVEQAVHVGAALDRGP